MPPKISMEEQVNEGNDKTDAQQHQQQTSPYYTPQHTRSLSELSVGEILVKYQDDNHLLNHILLAKAQEDKRRTAEELRQAEEARLQTKFIEYELTHRGDNSNPSFVDNMSSSNGSLFAGGSSSSNNNNTTDTSFMNSNDPFTDQVGHSLQAGMATTHDTSPLPMTMSEFQYMQQQDNTSSISSSSPSMDFVTPSNFDLYNSNMSFSCSPPADLPLFPPQITKPVKEITPPIVKSSTITKSKKKSTSPKNIHRTLSYESVMTLSDLNIRPAITSPPPPPPQPLDHDKVIEALRAKLRKSSSPYQNSRPTKPSPEPVPPPNTYPTTGVLLLNLKSRRRKSSVTKRSNTSKS